MHIIRPTSPYLLEQIVQELMDSVPRHQILDVHEVLPLEHLLDLRPQLLLPHHTQIHLQPVLPVNILPLHKIDHNRQFLDLFVAQSAPDPPLQSLLHHLLVPSRNTDQSVFDGADVLTLLQLREFVYLLVQFRPGLLSGKCLVEVGDGGQSSLVFGLDLLQQSYLLFQLILSFYYAGYFIDCVLFQDLQSFPVGLDGFKYFVDVESQLVDGQEIAQCVLRTGSKDLPYHLVYLRHLLVQVLDSVKEKVTSELELKIQQLEIISWRQIMGLNLHLLKQVYLSSYHILALLPLSTRLPQRNEK